MSAYDTSPPASSEHARRTMTANRRKDTSIEIAVRSRLFAAGARYRVDFAPDPENKRRRADIVFTRARVAVFIDGCFWHGCDAHFVMPKSNVEYWSSKIERNRARDLDTSSRLESLGWKVLRFWEHDDPSTAADEILAAIRKRNGTVDPREGSRGTQPSGDDRCRPSEETQRSGGTHAASPQMSRE